MLVFAAIVALFFALAMLASCAGDTPLCLFACTVIVRTGSAGDDVVTEEDRHRAREWLMRQEKAAQKAAMP